MSVEPNPAAAAAAAQPRGGWETLGTAPAAAPLGSAPEAAPASQPRFGPLRLADGRTCFRLWAPDMAAEGEIPRLEIHDAGPVLMTPAADGWFEATVACCEGARYWFRLGDGTIVPDPASRAQAGDVHGASVVVNPAAYQWCHPYWQGRPWHEAIIYEMHVGLCGGYAGAARELPRLAALGFTAVELMPLAEFPGSRNWGYDGVLPFAPESSYGTPDQLRALIDAAHGLGMMVLLDVVYNHFGPEGNYLPRYASAFFREDVRTPWGPAIDFRRQEVRDFFTENASYWLQDFRFDGLRLDAVHAIADEGWLAELAPTLRQRCAGRQIHLVLENDNNDAALLAGGYDAQWNDDAHHVLHVLLTGEHDGYYADYGAVVAPEFGAGADAAHRADSGSHPGPDYGRAYDQDAAPRGDHQPLGPTTRHLARVLAEGFAYQGEASPHRTRESGGDKPVHRGQRSADLPPTAFISFLQNHDQIGNRAFGERITALAKPRPLRAAIALQLLCPQIPMVFMGEEGGTQTPFLYFTSHPPELADAVREGRRREFGSMAGFADGARADSIPDPNAPTTFEASRPEFDPDGEYAQYYKSLITLRRRELLPRLPGTRCEGAAVLGDAAVRASWRLGDGALLTLWANLGDAVVSCGDAPQGELLAESEPGAARLLEAGTLPAGATVAYLQSGQQQPSVNTTG
ncbi:alpha-amylase family glycosyl hydrolase [Cupriavidus sp. UGS-1]|nr:alpha-amylase family glycosyl hydrolase [Cupriavidus sp. UGS-1]MCD9119664.1 DUF3459 domain-containing protein [Cupriavidus sp. UGS-1]